MHIRLNCRKATFKFQSLEEVGKRINTEVGFARIRRCPGLIFSNFLFLLQSPSPIPSPFKTVLCPLEILGKGVAVKRTAHESFLVF